MVSKPVMAHILDLLKRHGITEVVMTLQFMPEAIQGYFGDGQGFGLRSIMPSKRHRWVRLAASRMLRSS